MARRAARGAALVCYCSRVATPRVPLQHIAPSRRLDAALRLAAGPSAGTLSATLSYLCEQLAAVCASAVASVYVLEEREDLVLRGNYGFPDAVLGEVRLKVGQGITGTALETMRPMTVVNAARRRLKRRRKVGNVSV